MQPKSDVQLLQEYAGQGTEAAFAEIVQRYTNLVYSAVLRQVESPAVAAEIAQNVFVGLARGARSLSVRLPADASLAGWLCRSARNLSLNHRRDEFRRKAREREAMEQFINSDPASDWERLRPTLDDAMSELDEMDYDALVLRYYSNQDLRSVGVALGVSDDAAQKRVSRALDRLRDLFAKRGITVGAGGLGAVLSANAVQAAPPGLTAAISTALDGTTFGATTAAATHAIAMTTFQKTLVAATIAVLAGAGIYEARQSGQLRQQNRRLQQQQTLLAEQIQHLRRERDDQTNRLAGLAAENGRLRSGSDQTELLKLRREVSRLTAEESDPTRKAVKAVAEKITSLKQRLEQNPRWAIPELQFITDKDWAAAVWDADLNTEDGVRQTLSTVREGAINRFLNEMMKDAFKKYLAANGNVLPADLYALRPYFDKPVTDAMIERYKLLQQGSPENAADLVRLVANADDEYDSNHGMSINGAWGTSFNRVQERVDAAANAFRADHVGQLPDDASQLGPYLKTPVDTATVQKYLNELLAHPPPPELTALAPALKAYSDANNGSMPKNPSDLLPYLTTSEQKAALQKIERDNPDAK